MRNFIFGVLATVGLPVALLIIVLLVAPTFGTTHSGRRPKSLGS